ncbi:hypothetical protein Plec18170_005867 [Paecilomyces lecythidis]
MPSSPDSPSSISWATKGRGDQRPRTRTVAPKKVYGKRRANAPRAILASPPRETADVETIETTLDAMQAKLASVKLDDNVKEEENIVVEDVGIKEDDEIVEAMEAITLADKQHEGDDVKTEERMSQTYTPKKKRESVGEVRQRMRDHIASTPLNHTPKPKRRWQVLAEVRIHVKPACNAQEAHTAKDISISNAKAVTKGQKKKFRPRLSSSCIKDEKTNAYVRPILNEAMSPIASQGVQKFDSWAARTGNVFDVIKIAEGSYGEVYKLRIREDACKEKMSKSKLAKLRAYGDGVFKIVPLRAKTGPGSRKFTSIDEIASEVKLLKYLDAIPGFARFREIHVVQGRFPTPFQAAWDTYSQTKDDCWNPNPADKKAYPDKQLWAILEMDDAGCELEKFKWSSAFQIYDIFWGVAMALARAEEYAKFEDGSMEPPSSVDNKVLESSSGFGLSSLETTIIDYSLSRAELRFSEDPNEQPEIASTDLDKKQIFDAIGMDEDEALLRNTMRGEVYKGDPLDQEKPEDIPGIWSDYMPRTNLIWLLFLLKNLLKHRKDNQEKQPQAPRRQPLGVTSGNVNKNIKPKAAAKSESGKKKTKVLAAESRSEKQGTNNKEEPSKKVEQTLYSRLDRTLELLDLEHGHEDMCCAADLVAYAIDSEWLDEKDFFNA